RWNYDNTTASKEIPKKNGWDEPDEKRLPYAGDIYNEYLYPLSKTPELEPYIYLNSKVVSVGRKYMDKRKTRERSSNPFMIKTIQDGSLKNYEMSAIIDASGIWKNPNPIISGLYYFSIKEELKDSMFYGISDILVKDKDLY